MLVATHDGRFHADELFAISALILQYGDFEVVRTRDPEIYSRARLRVDVGMKYNPSTGDFDHHQDDFNMKRGCGTPYASAGLVWHNFGRGLVKSDMAFDFIDKKIIRPIDAADNGIYPVIHGIKPTLLAEIVGSYSPEWNSDQDIDDCFYDALDFSLGFLRRKIGFANSLEPANELIEEAIRESNGRYVVFDPPTPPWKAKVSNKTDILFGVYQYSWDRWASEATFGGGGKRKILFPKHWAGLDEELADVTGVRDALFCHKNRFIATASTKEGAIALTELALEERLDF